jgi:hypothetical protein
MIELWPGRAHPAMTIAFPDADRSRARPALVVVRGGGYARCDGSGAGTAAWAARNGMVGCAAVQRCRSEGRLAS